MRKKNEMDNAVRFEMGGLLHLRTMGKICIKGKYLYEFWI
jgi:hypothetical protein